MILRYRTKTKRRGEACEFDRIASGFLGDIGFVLRNDPSEIISPYFANRVLYGSIGGFFLCAGFDPLDGSSAQLSGGRLWTVDGEFYGLSGSYAELTASFGLALPSWYRLGVSDQATTTLNTMLQDLRDTLPIVLDRVSLSDLEGLERAERGIARRTQDLRGYRPGTQVWVSDFG